MIKLVRVIKKETKRFFYDCEFDENPIFGINLISIGIISEDGQELYLVNSEYNWSKCTNQWLIDNVKPYLKYIPDYLKVSKSELAKRIYNFLNPNAQTDIKLYRILFCI
jgi:hypothetical protein